MSQQPKPKTGQVSRIDTTQLKPTEIAAAIRVIIQVNRLNAANGRKRRGLFIWGGPGLGKSALVAQEAAAINFKLIDIRLTQMEPTDLRGIPVPTVLNADETVVRWAIPEVFPQRYVDPTTGQISRTANVVDKITGHKYDGAVILLDELPNAPPSVQAGSYQLVLDGALGEYVCPDNVVVIAAGNRDTDKGATYKMPTPLANRFVHVEIKEDYEEWVAHAVSEDYHPEVVGYVSAFKAELYQFDPKSASRGFPTPRSWNTVSDILHAEPEVNDQTLLGLIGGTVGDGVGVKFIEYRKNAARLPKASDILDGKNAEMPNKDVSLMYALTTSLCYELRDRYMHMVKDAATANAQTKAKFNEHVDNFLGYMMKNFQPEIVIMGSRTALHIFSIKFDPSKLKHWDSYTDRYQELILGA
jgi:hypothetical protein